jgi:hypothetical protein
LGVSVGRAEIKIPLPGDCSGLIPHTHKAPSPIHSTRKEKEKKKKRNGGREEGRKGRRNSFAYQIKSPHTLGKI